MSEFTVDDLFAAMAGGRLKYNWNADESYRARDLAACGDALYEAASDNQGVEPRTDATRILRISPQA